jgi:hypothetical protein
LSYGGQIALPILRSTVLAVIPFNGKRLRLAAVDAMRHDRAEQNFKAAGNAAADEGGPP